MSKFDARRRRLLRKFRKLQIDGMLVTHEPNVTYLTGFTGEATSLFLSRREAILISDSRFETQIQEECDGLEVAIRTQATTSTQHLVSVLANCAARDIGFEADHTSVAVCEGLQSDLATHQWLQVRGVIESLRAIKDRDEITAIRQAIQVAEKTIAVVAAGLTADQTEQQVVAELEYRIRQFGGSGCAFPPIVGVGPRAALPHAPPTDTRMGESHHVLIDWGARVGQYVSDLTRVFFTGKIPPKLQRIYGVVLNAQLTAIAAIRPDARVADIDKAARRVIADAGYARYFGHGLGHGIGLEVHEEPRLSANQQGTLSAGMVVTVEPGIYLPGWGGVRIEDDVLVTRDGHEVLSSITKDLDACGVTL